MSDDAWPARLTAAQARAAIDAGAITAEALAAACLARIAEREPRVRAWACLDPLAGARAAAQDGARAVGALRGVPVGVKDVIQTRGLPTRFNSPLAEGLDGGVDAACVTLLRAAGAVILGKTETAEFAATGAPAPTRNPHDLRRTPGGSSSGSAAAVADGHVPIALGTQTGGSIIRPASFCGAYGFKPSWGVVSTEGVRAFAPSLDTVGWFARSVEDLLLVLDVFDPRPAGPVPAAGALRIAVCRTPRWDRAGPGAKAALESAERALRAAGAAVETMILPPLFDDASAAQVRVMRAEGGRSFLPLLPHGGRLHPDLRRMAEEAGADPQGLRAAYDLAARCRERFDELAARYDAVLAPSAPDEAPLRAQGTGDLVFNGMWTLLHAPCANVPGFVGAAGLPIGVTLTGPRFADRRVLAAAAACDAAFRAAARRA